jgi:hypothetical protein
MNITMLKSCKLCTSRSTSISKQLKLIHTQGCGIFGALGQGNNLLDSKAFEKLDLSGKADYVITAKVIHYTIYG